MQLTTFRNVLVAPGVEVVGSVALGVVGVAVASVLKEKMSRSSIMKLIAGDMDTFFTSCDVLTLQLRSCHNK